MGDTVTAAIALADASADGLDDPIDLENHAIRNWLRHHVSFKHGAEHYVVGTEMLPARWRALCKAFHFESDAMHFLRTMAHHHAAMNGMRNAAMAVNGAPFCATDAAIINILAQFLFSGRAWVIRTRKMPPRAGATDPAVYQKLNSDLGTAVDFAYLARWEGGQYLRGYVPFSNGVVAGRSGLTIATGFDVGQRSEANLADMGLPPEVGPRLAPYAGVRFTGMKHPAVLKIVLERGPIPVLTKPEADAVDALVHREYLLSARDSFNVRHQPRVPNFEALPGNWQTVLFSRTFHQGVGMPNTPVAQTFYTAVTAGRWNDAIKALRNCNVSAAWYKIRVQQEADLLATKLPPAVVPQAAPGRP